MWNDGGQSRARQFARKAASTVCVLESNSIIGSGMLFSIFCFRCGISDPSMRRERFARFDDLSYSASESNRSEAGNRSLECIRETTRAARATLRERKSKTSARCDPREHETEHGPIESDCARRGRDFSQERRLVRIHASVPRSCRRSDTIYAAGDGAAIRRGCSCAALARPTQIYAHGILRDVN